MKQTFLLILFSFFSLNAQDIRQITLDDAIAIGLESNIGLQRSALQMQQQNLSITEIRTATKPALNFQHGWNANLGPNFSTTTGQRSIKPTFSTNMGVGAQIPLFQQGQLNHFWKPELNFRNFPALLEVEAQKEALIQQQERNKEQVRFSILSAFLTLINNAEVIKLREADLNLQKEQLQKLKILIQGGQRAEADKFQQESAIAQADFQLLKANQAKQSAEIQLVQTLRLSPLVKYAFILPELSQIKAPEDLDISQIIADALENRADIKSFKLQVAANGYGIKTAKTGKLPTLSLSGNVGTSYVSEASGVIPKQYFDNLNGGIGLSLSVPLIDNGRTSRQVQSSQIRYEQSVLDLENAQQIAATEIQQAYQEYTASYEQLKSAEALESASQKSLTAEQSRFDLGVSTLYERNQAQKSLTDAQSQRIQASFEYIFRKYILDYYIGK